MAHFTSSTPIFLHPSHTLKKQFITSIVRNMSLCLKVRGPGAPISMICAPSLSWKEFKELLVSQLSLKAPFDVLYGFPPRVEDHPDERLISEFLTTNENIRVQLKTSAGQQAQGVAVAPKKTKKAPARAEEKPAAGFGAKIIGVQTAKATKSFLASSPQKRSLSSVNAQDPPPAKRRRKSSASGTISSENDIADHLISAVSGGTGSHNRAARKVFRNAVLHQYNSSQAVSRVNAIFSGKYTIRQCGGVLLSSTSSSSTRPNVFTHIEVTYNKGAGSRGEHVDTVELLPKELLLGVLKVAVLGDSSDGQNADEGKEALKPMNLSKCSPRIFWSIVHHYGPNLVENIRTILKGVDDCAWLDERKKQLSEKAQENLQQANEAEARRAGKRGAKKGTAANEPVSTAATLAEAIPASTPPTSAMRYSPKDPLSQVLIRVVLDAVQLGDIVPEEWRAAVEAHTRTTPELAVLELARLECNPGTRNALQDLRDPSTALSLDQLESWIVSAQMQVFHAVWRCICGGGSERLRSALFKLRVRVPRDFRMWKKAPAGLLHGLADLDSELIGGTAYRWAEGHETEAKVEVATLAEDRVAWMCKVAEAAQGVFPWIDDEQLHSASDDANTDADTDESAVADEDNEWQFHPDAHRHMGRRARVLVENDYWEDGTVAGYLPPEPEEPMALWRVRLDAAVKGTGAAVMASPKAAAGARNEDLEEHELEEAFARLQQ